MASLVSLHPGERARRGQKFVVAEADHSFGLQVDGERCGETVLEGHVAWKASESDADIVRLKNVLVNRTHTAEEVPALAIGGRRRASPRLLP